jgi:glycosyltransferase involved in cell wall biosynthesis
MANRTTRGTYSETGRPRVIVLSATNPGRFVRQDCELLSSSFAVDLIIWRGLEDMSSLRREIAASAAVVIWFAGRHALPGIILARCYRKPTAIIVGGWEAAWLPQVRYGIRPGSLRQRVLRSVLKSAAVLLPVSDATLRGTQDLVPEMTAHIKRIYHAVNSDRFRPDPSVPRKSVLTVANFGREAITVKGLRLFRETAALMPDCGFVAVGPVVDSYGKEFLSDCPANLRWDRKLAGSDLVQRFQAASVYFQGSLHESFSVATAEAMACGCIPVVSRRGALPEVVGDTGVYLDTLTPEAAAAAIRTAMKLPESQRMAARQRVIDCFGIDRRRIDLCAAIDDLTAVPQQSEGLATPG